MDGWIKLSENGGRAVKYVNRRNIVSVNDVGGGVITTMWNGDTVRLTELPPDEPKLPYDAEVEWLESTGTQYVDTGVIMDNTSIWSVRAKFASPGTDSFVMGQTANGVENRSAWGLHKSGAWYCGLGNKNWTGGVGDTSWHDFIVNAPADMFMVDSLSYRIGHASFSSVTSPIGFATLFARRNLSTGGIDTFCEMRVAALTITQSDTLVRNFIPVRVGPLGYLYDRANPTGGPLGNGLYGDFSDGKGGVTGFPANLVGPDNPSAQ